MKRTNSDGFTLIELLISTTIFLILVIMTYVNYAYYQNIAKVKIGVKEVSQSINNARNMAINGYMENDVNQSIGIYFDLNDKNKIKYYSFNYESGIVLDDTYKIKEEKIDDYVGFDYLHGENNIMIYFSSIYGISTIYTFDASLSETEITDTEIEIGISFKDALNYPLKRELKYYKNTNLIDY